MRLAPTMLVMLTLWLRGAGASPGGESSRGVAIQSPVAGTQATANGRRSSAETARVEAQATGAWAAGAPLCLTAVVTFPDGALERVSLHDDGKFGDETAGDGRFANRLTGLEQPGEYTVRVKAWQAGEVAWSEPRTFGLTPPKPKPGSRPTVPPPPPAKPLWPWAVLAMAVTGCLSAWVSGRMVARKAREGEAPAEPVVAETGQRPILREGAEQALRDQRRQLFSSMAEMLVQLPSVRKAVSDGATLQARDLLPLLTPLDSALERLGFERIGQPGERVDFGPTRHQMAGAQPPPEPGAPVEVVFVGYLEGGEVLRKAQVKGL